ncbi:MAG: response associated peptidase [Bacilli bacterium]|nr:response associated peptidase [Bacilli bacterium]
MCGRYTITVSLEELMLQFFIDPECSISYYQPRYNIAPGQMVMAIINDGAHNRLGELKWGMIPQRAQDEKGGFKMINARAETVAQKPAFQRLLERKRCIIPADSFYEWKKVGDMKQPLRIRLENGELFAMAGLYDTWIAPDGRKVSSCTIITTEANELMADIHDRMPVILRPEAAVIWLNREVHDLTLLQSLLKPYAAEEMETYPVSSLVGNVRNELPACIEKIQIT